MACTICHQVDAVGADRACVVATRELEPRLVASFVARLVEQLEGQRWLARQRIGVPEVQLGPPVSRQHPVRIHSVACRLELDDVGFRGGDVERDDGQFADLDDQSFSGRQLPEETATERDAVRDGSAPVVGLRHVRHRDEPQAPHRLGVNVDSQRLAGVLGQSFRRARLVHQDGEVGRGLVIEAGQARVPRAVDHLAPDRRLGLSAPWPQERLLYFQDSLKKCEA